mgnify:CR=1 FL=1
MKFFKFTFLSFVLLSVIFLCSSLSIANESSVKIEAKEKVEKGKDVEIKLHVTHDGNNIFHGTDELWIKINGEEVKKWEYGVFSGPPSENFTKTITYTANENLEVESKAYCNLHGSNNTAQTTIYVESE